MTCRISPEPKSEAQNQKFESPMSKTLLIHPVPKLRLGNGKSDHDKQQVALEISNLSRGRDDERFSVSPGEHCVGLGGSFICKDF